MIRFLQFSDIHFLFCEETEDDYAQMRIRFIEDFKIQLMLLNMNWLDKCTKTTRTQKSKYLMLFP